MLASAAREQRHWQLTHCNYRLVDAVHFTCVTYVRYCDTFSSGVVLRELKKYSSLFS